MSAFDAFRYDGKRAVVVGGATGMGAAVVDVLLDAGAEVVAADVAPITREGVTALEVNLADRASIDAFLEQLEGPVHALFPCAGVADGTPGIERINYVGHRYLIDRLVDSGRLGRGSAIGFISSAAGLGWEANLDVIAEVLDITDFDAAAAWFVEKGWADYFHTKQVICAYVAHQAYPMLCRGIRINALCPGPTDTPLARANEEMWLGFGADYRADAGVAASTPIEQAWPLVFLCSDAAVAVNGITLVSDAGYVSAGVTGAYPAASEAAHFLLGR